MTEIETMPDPKPTEFVVTPELWVAVYWMSTGLPASFPMYSVGRNKHDAIKYAVESSHRDPEKPIKLFRLNYGDR